jgi:ribonucleoside-triphosphate reductase
MNFKGNGVFAMMEIHTKDSLFNEYQPSLKNIKVVKRDGRHTAFDDQKIYDALIKAETKIKGSVDPLAHERIQSIVERVDAEISERFTSDIKIYEIQNIVEHTLLEHNEYE